MFKLLLILVVVIVGMIMYQNKIKIKWHTFFKKGFKVENGPWGVYCYDGKQGSFKTYSVVEFLLENKDKRIYSNVTSIQGVKYTPIGDIDDLLSLRSESDCIIFFDEIFTAITKSSRINADVDIMDFLSQMRKRHIIFLTTAQEWLELDITLRRYCRYRIHCEPFHLPFNILTIIVKQFYDAEHMKWSNDENEYVAPLLETTISKPNLVVANSYDTFETIKPSRRKSLKRATPGGC